MSWQEIARENRERRESHRVYGLQRLRTLGIPHLVVNENTQVVIHYEGGRILFTPGTGMWTDKGEHGYTKARGLVPLLTRVREVKVLPVDSKEAA